MCGSNCEVSKYLDILSFSIELFVLFLINMLSNSKFEKFLSFNSCRSVVVSAGLLRIFGRETAELPIVATSRDNRGKVSAGQIVVKD